MITAVTTHNGVLGGAAAASSFDGFDDRYWTKTANTVCFTSHYSSIADSISTVATDYTRTYYQGDPDTALPQNGYVYSFAGDTSYLDSAKLAGNVISVTGLAFGETKTVTVTIKSLYDATVSAQFTLTLKRLDEITLNDGNRLDVDSSLYNDSDNKYGYTFTAKTSGETVESVKIGGNIINGLTTNVSGNSVTISFTQSQLRSYLGEQTITIVTNEAIYTLDAAIASLIISNETEFMKIKAEYYKGSPTATAAQYRDGYFILSQNIDMKGKMFSLFDSDDLDNGNGGTWNKWNQAAISTYGWSGTIDGRGHTVYNVKTGYRGMFGHISEYGVLQNLGVRCLEITTATSGVLASFHVGVIDNCFVELAAMPNLAQVGVFVWQIRNNATISNSIAVLLTEDTTSYATMTNDNAHGSIATKCQDARYGFIKNVYSVRIGSLAAIAQNPSTAASSAFGAFGSFADMITAVTTHTGLSGGSAAINASSFNNFNSTYWTIDTTLNTVTFGTYKATL